VTTTERDVQSEIDALGAMIGLSPADMKAFQLFMPYAVRQIMMLWKNSTKFVYYTTAATASEIIKKKEIWMRRASCMNDFMEAQHGLDCLVAAYRHEDSGARFKAIIEDAAAGLTKEIEELFNGWAPHFSVDTYLTCLSEHDAEKEDGIGRLSMWRAYGKYPDVGVALVVNTAPFYSTASNFGAMSSPVAYLDGLSFRGYFDEITANISNNLDFVRNLGRDRIRDTVFHAFRFASLCTKHPGFREEREWRIVYSPTMNVSPYIKQEIETIRGIPQPVCKIPLRNVPEAKLAGAEIPELLARIIIGPTQYPVALRDAFINLLKDANVPDPEKKVFMSDIPLRIP
jgi:Protein of unknown function (DUF2971)